MYCIPNAGILNPDLYASSRLILKTKTCLQIAGMMSKEK